MKKINVYILLTVLVTMLMMFSLCFMICQYTMDAENHARYVGIMNVTSEKIATTISGMEMNAMNVFDEVEKNMESPESVINALKSKAGLNPDAKGYFAAFEPDHFPQKGRWFEPYVHQTANGEKYVVSQIGSARHDYTKSEWYIRAQEEGMSFWSDPYYFYDGTSISGRYCTFVEPIFDSEKNPVCVCGAAMTLEWLSKELKQIDNANKQNNQTNSFLSNKDLDFYTVVLNDDGSCIASPEEMSVSITEESTLNDLKQRKSGMIETTVNGEDATIYYGPIKNIEWSVAVAVPTKNVKGPVIIVGLIMLAVVVLGMIIVYFSKRYILLTMGVTMLAMLILTVLICRSSINAETQIRYTGILNVASEKINKSISGMEMNAMNIFDELQKHLDSPEDVIAALMSKTRLNTDIKGYFAAFEPDYFPQKGKWFQPYVHKAEDSNEYIVSQLETETFDYTKSDLYVRAKKEGKSFWSDPYKYHNGTSMSGHYCSFMTPLYDANGKLVCVCGADMTFEWLNEELKQIDYRAKQDELMKRFFWNEEPDFHTVIMNSDGSCISNTKGDNVETKLEEATLYSTPISHTLWTMAVVVPQQDAIKPLLIIGMILLSVVVLGMIVVWIVLRSVRYDEY